MRILILGSTGILGHTLFIYLSKITSFEVIGICRDKSKSKKFYQKYSSSLLFFDLNNFDELPVLIYDLRPQVVINCAVKKDFDKINILPNILINSILPHKINELSITYNFKFIHISTDSIFGDNFVNKSETDIFEVKDLYSASKLLGEPIGKNTFVLRTSIVGHSLTGKEGFLDSVRSANIYRGSSNVFFSGTTVLELAKIIHGIITKPKKISDLYHVTAKEVSKLNLAKLISYVYALDLRIIEVTEIKSKRLLSSMKFDQNFMYTAPEWEYLLNDLKNFYDLNADVYEECE